MNTQTDKMSFKDMLKSRPLILVDFYAEWCGPCKMLSPIIEKVKSKVGDKATIIKVDVDKNQAALAAYEIMGVPTLILFKNGKIVWRQSGVVQEHTLTELINSYSKN